MAQANSTAIQLYYSNTAGVSPSSASLISGELAINLMDGKLFYKDGSNNVNTIATAASAAGYFPKITFTNDATEQVTASAPWAWTNAASTQANSANTLAKAGYVQANSANNLADAAYYKANVGGTFTGSVTILQDLAVNGNLSVLGTSTTIKTSTLDVGDSLIYLANNNSSSDQVDIGIIGHYKDTTNAHAGIIRDPNLKEWIFFKGYTPEVQSNNLIDINHASFSYANTYAGWFKGNLIGSSASIGGMDILSYTNSSYTQANAANILATAAFTVANTGTVAFAAFGQANAANSLASAAYYAVNTIVIVANTVSLGTGTVDGSGGAVPLTTATTVTDGLAKINVVLGKLVPASPATFPSSYGTLSITGTVGPYRMTNFTQTDNTGTGTASVAAGTSVSPLRTSSYTTSTITNIKTVGGDVISVYKNGSVAGTRTITDGATNAGTYSDLVILTNPDYASVTGIAATFWYSANIVASGTVSFGWNRVYITDTGGSPTSAINWYYDNSAPGSPTFSSTSIVPLSTSTTYSSTIPHYNSSTTFKLGVNVSKLSGDLYPSSDTFLTGTAGGAFGTPTSNTYSGAGITTPLARNLYVSSGSATVNSVSTIISGFGSSSVGPSVTVNNSYATNSQTFTSALGSTVLYKTGTSSSMEESTVTFGSTVGTGSGLASRIVNPGSTDTPTYSSGATLFDSVNGPLQTYDATIVAGILKHDQINYSTGYLPVGPNLSSGRTSAQYFTFRFVRTSVSKFDIKFTGTIAGLWVALPGSSIDISSSINGWMDMSIAYGGSGHPGPYSVGNGSNGCALGGTVVLNSLVTNASYTCTFGDVSSSSTATNEIYVRIKLNSGQTVSALSLQTASH